MKELKQSAIIGATFAVLAALSNGTVGVLSRTAFQQGLDPTTIAFARCGIALLVVSLIALMSKGAVTKIRQSFRGSLKIAICSALGIFTLYHFETQALSFASIPLVSILVFAGGLGAIALDIFILKEKVTLRKAFAMALVFGGGVVLIGGDGLARGSLLGVGLALIAGFGYASFIFSWKFFMLKSNLENFWWFLAYGFLMLGIPYAISGAPALPLTALPNLAALGLIPSLCGFYCTILAIQHIEAYKAQVIESSEPFFSALLAALIFGEWLSGQASLAGLSIICGALITAAPEKHQSAPLAPTRAIGVEGPREATTD
ncbi:DMT family transporter [Allorhizobium undicola]|uniref:DMT family transporter n=1 Tax=Allorhizobium undicola TaxID=78527 RepID=UPI003D33EB9B